MAPALRQKKFKVEIRFTVRMDEIEAEPANPSFAWQLQQALLKDEPALSRLMQSAMFNKLQGYADYLAAQDELTSLKEAAQALLTEDHGEAVPRGADFTQDTRPLRISCMNVRMDDSTIQEQVTPGEGDCQWQMVWQDLRPNSTLGLLFEMLAIPTTPIFL